MPGVSRNEEFKTYKFPLYKPEPLLNHAPRLENDGLDLLTGFLDVRTRFILFEHLVARSNAVIAVFSIMRRFGSLLEMV